MKVLAFVAVATLLVVGTKSDAPTMAEREAWVEECRGELGYNSSTIARDPLTELRREKWCFYACILGKEGIMQNGILAERTKVSDYFVGLLNSTPAQAKEGRTFLQLAEKCYDEGNVKTEKCEIAEALGSCIENGVLAANNSPKE